MFGTRFVLIGLIACFGLGTLTIDAQTKDDKKKEKKAEKKQQAVWTDATDPSLPADFKFQGEYSAMKGDEGIGCQVIALGNGTFQAVLCKHGLPGAGWDGKNKSLLEGK